MIYWPPDHPQQANDLLPGIAARGPAEEYFVELTQPIGDLDLRVYEVYDALTDIGMASGDLLDLRGSLAFQPRRGLIDREYRQIVDAREVAAAGAVVPSRVWAGWRALTGTSDGEMVTTGPARGYLVANVAWAPSSSFLTRGTPILRTLVGTTRGVSGILAPPGALILDVTPLGAGVLSYSL